MNEKKTVTVAGVPVTIAVAGRELAVQVGRFDPQAAAGRLRVNSLSGAAVVAVHVAGEGGPGERWVAGLYPADPGAAEQLLLCDGCFQATTGLLAECQDGCRHGDLDHDGLCLRDSSSECQWCGAQGRLREVPRAGVERRLPTVGEEDEGLWWLHHTDGAQGPFPSAQDAWDYWHANGDGEIPSRLRTSRRKCRENLVRQNRLPAVLRRRPARGRHAHRPGDQAVPVAPRVRQLRGTGKPAHNTRRPRKRALPEPAGELPADDVTAVGDVRLAARPQPAPPSDSAASTAKEYRDGCP